MIETYSYEKYKGVLLENLRKKLAQYSVKFEPINIEILYEKLNQSNYVDSFTELLGTFLNHYKSNQLNLEHVRNKIDALIIEEKKDSKIEGEDTIEVYEPASDAKDSLASIVMSALGENLIQAWNTLVGAE